MSYTYTVDNIEDWPAALDANEMIDPYAARVNADLNGADAIERVLRPITAQTYTNRLKVADKTMKSSIKFIRS